MHKHHGECKECQVCGKEDATTVCTYVITEEGKKETDCWCVCEECKDKLKEGVHDFYRGVLDEKGDHERPKK